MNYDRIFWFVLAHIFFNIYLVLEIEKNISTMDAKKIYRWIFMLSTICFLMSICALGVGYAAPLQPNFIASGLIGLGVVSFVLWFAIVAYKEKTNSNWTLGTYFTMSAFTIVSVLLGFVQFWVI